MEPLSQSLQVLTEATAFKVKPKVNVNKFCSRDVLIVDDSIPAYNATDVISSQLTRYCHAGI